MQQIKHTICYQIILGISQQYQVLNRSSYLKLVRLVD